MPGGGAGRLATPDAAASTGAPSRDVRAISGAGPASPPTRLNPRGVQLTFEHPRHDVSEHPVLRSPSTFAGPWGFPPRRRPRPIARPTRLAPVAFASPPRLSLEAACRASSLRSSRSAPLLGFPALQHMPDPRVHLHGGSEPSATSRPQGFDPLAGFLPASPPGPISCRSAPGLRPSGVLSSGPVGTSHEVRHPHDVGCPPAVHFTAAWGGRNRPRTPQARPRGFPYPESGTPDRLLSLTPESAPLLGFLLPEASVPPVAPPRSGGHPPMGFRATFGLAPRDRPGPPGSSTTGDLARLRASSLSGFSPI